MEEYIEINLINLLKEAFAGGYVSGKGLADADEPEEFWNAVKEEIAREFETWIPAFNYQLEAFRRRN